MTRQNIFIIALFFSSALAFADMPEWIEKPYESFSKNDYIAAVGEDDTKENSQEKAVNQIESIFASTAEDFNVTVALDFPESYYDKKSKKWYCLVLLDKNKAISFYSETILQNENAINKTLSECQGKSFDEISKLKDALLLSKKNEKLNSSLLLLDARPFANLKSPQEIQTLLQSTTKKFPIFVNIQDGESIEPIVKKALLAKDYQVSDFFWSRMICAGTAEYNFSKSDSFILCEIILNLRFLDSQTGKVYIPFSVTVREGATSEEMAKTRALETLNTKIDF